MLKRIISRLMSIFVLVSLLSVHVEAEETENGAVIFYGTAQAINDLSIQLTPCETWKAGGVWFNEPIDTTQGVHVEFSYWAGGGRNLNSFGGADGILCTFADKPGLGASGMDIGFVGGESYAVEIDSYSNSGNDPAGKHFGIVYQSISNHLETYSSDCTDDSQWHHMAINCFDGVMNVLLDDRVIMQAGDIQLKDQIYLGFTAATGSGCNLQKIKEIFISYGDRSINYIPERPAETPLDFIGTSYTFFGKKPIELKAVYIGDTPENTVVEVDDPTAFDGLSAEWTGQDEGTNKYAITVHANALNAGEYKFTLRNGDLSATVPVNIVDFDEAEINDPGLILYQAQFLIDDSVLPSMDIWEALEFETPSEKLLKAAYENNLDVSTNAWKGVKVVLDSTDDPTELVSLVVEPYDLYRGIIMSIVEKSVELDLFDDRTEDAFGLCKDIVGTVNDFMKVNHDLIENDDLSTLSEDKQKELLEQTGEWFKKKQPDLAYYGELFKGCTEAFKLIKSEEDFYKTVSYYMALAKSTEDIRAALSKCYRESLDTDNIIMQRAFKNCLDSVDRNYVVNTLVDQSFAIGTKTVKYLFREKIWNECIINSMPPTVTAAMALVKTTREVVNKMFACDDIADAYKSVKAIVDVESIFKDVVYISEQDFITGTNLQRAGELITSMRLAYSAIDIDCDKADDFVDAVNNAFVTTMSKWIIHLISGTANDQYADAIKTIAREKTTFSNTYKSGVNGWRDYICDNYNPFTGQNDWTGPIPKQKNKVGLAAIWVDCPVNVYVYDEGGNLAASVIDGYLSNHDDNLMIGRMNDSKVIHIYSGSNYQIEYVGTDDGSMDITIENISAEGEVTRTQFYEDIPLTTGKQYSMPVSSEPQKYPLINDAGNYEAASYDTAENKIYSATIKGGMFIVDGEIEFSAELPAGKTASVTTITPEGYEFVNWTSDADITFSDSSAVETTFVMPEEDVEIRAVFKKMGSPFTDPEKIELNLSDTEIYSGDTIQLDAIVVPESSANPQVTWAVSDEKIISVDSNGLVTGLKPGKATVTASTINGLSATCHIQVLFTDVAKNMYYFTPVYWAVENGITNGYTDSDKIIRTFKPENNCTREAVVTFLWRLAGKPEPQNLNSSFSDIQDKGKYYYKAVLWAAEQGITKGYPDGSFKPNATCLREHVVTFLYRYAGKPAPKTAKNPFNDVYGSDYYYQAAIWANENGIAKGYSSGDNAGGFGPKLDCLREHVVTFLYRYNKKYSE